MFIATLIAASCLTGLAVLHVVAGKFFSVVIVNGKRAVNPAFQPPAAVLMSVRGCDPSLEKCLAALLRQTYADYGIYVVVDHVSDDAWARVQRVKAELDTANRLNILELNEPLNSCSLKCSALVQAISSLPPSVELLVLVDADVIPHQEWLMQATSPMCDPAVGVVTGNQWFEPAGDSPGSLLRSLWNAGALVPTAVLANPWGGTCAMRLADVRAAGLVEIWRRSIVDDGPIRDAFKPLGKHVVFNPELIMVNRENCTVGYVNRYVPRMLTWSRVYEQTFIDTFLYMVVLAGCFLATCGLTIAALVLGQWTALVAGLAAMTINVLLNLAAWLTIRRSIQRIESRRDEADHLHYLGRTGLLRILKLAVLIPVCQAGFGLWMVRAVFSRRVRWRQITYEVHSRDRVRMMSYRPMRVPIEGTVQEVSI